MILWHGMVALPTSVTILATEERRKGYASFRMNAYGETTHLYMNKEPRSSIIHLSTLLTGKRFFLFPVFYIAIFIFMLYYFNRK